MISMAWTLAGCGGEVLIEPTPTATRTVRPTPTITATPAPTPTLGPGANIGFIGVLRADETLLPPADYDDEGRPVYERGIGFSFNLVVDAKPGTDGSLPGTSAFNYVAGDPSARPDLQIEANRDLGNGSSTVCDNMSPDFGGIPGIDPPSFAETQAISDALNDFGCRFNDGTGSPGGRDVNSACVLFPDGTYHFVDPVATVEFCAAVNSKMAFPPGDTIVTAQVRDIGGQVGPQRQIVIRVTPP